MSSYAVQQALNRLGIAPESLLMVHSAFKQLSRDGYDPSEVVAGFVNYMRPGTLLMPTMSWRFVNKAHPVFEELTTPSNTGVLTEIFRQKYADMRSCHPTHSVAGRGCLTQDILSSHDLDDTPCSARSPFGLHAERNGWVLLMGISIDCCTLIHAMEEHVAPELYLQPASQKETYMCRTRKGEEKSVALRRHRFLPRNYFQFQDELAREGLLRVTSIDNTIFRAFQSADMVRVVMDRLNRSPDSIMARPGDRYRMM